MARQRIIGLWMFASIGLIVLLFLFFKWYENARSAAKILSPGIVSLQQSADGHYYVNANIAEHTTKMLVDTGATYVAIPSRLANRLGLRSGAPVRLGTANGRGVGYLTELPYVEVGDIRISGIEAVIMPNLEMPLLGMSFLSRLSITQTDQYLVIKTPTH